MCQYCREIIQGNMWLHMNLKKSQPHPVLNYLLYIITSLIFTPVCPKKSCQSTINASDKNFLHSLKILLKMNISIRQQEERGRKAMSMGTVVEFHVYHHQREGMLSVDSSACLSHWEVVIKSKPKCTSFLAFQS